MLRTILILSLLLIAPTALGQSKSGSRITPKAPSKVESNKSNAPVKRSAKAKHRFANYSLYRNADINRRALKLGEQKRFSRVFQE
jgi:hypothetical protein